MPESDTGLLGIGEYTGRGDAPISQTSQSTVTTEPTPPAAPPSTPPPSAPPEPVPPQEPKADLIGDLSKAFAKTVGEIPSHPGAEPPKPAETSWRDAEPPPNATKSARQNWDIFREKAKADIDIRDNRIRALQEELEKVKQVGPEHETQLSEARKQAQEATDLLQRVAVERSLLFKSKVLDQENLLKARLGQLIEGTGITRPEAEAILYGDFSTRERVVESRNLSTFRRQQIAETMARWDNVQEERAKMLERGRETLQQYVREQQQSQESARAQFLRESEQVFNDQMALITPKLEVYNHIEGNDKWNQAADAMKTVARNIYSGSVPRETVAQAAILAPAAVAYQNLLKAAYHQIEELQRQVNGLRGVQPEIRDTGGDVTQPGAALSSANGDFVKNLVDRFRRDTGLQ